MTSYLKIKIKVDAKKAIKRMQAMEKRSEDFRAIFKWAKRELKKANELNFTSAGLPVGFWSPLNPRYASWKATKFPGAPYLVQSGKLFKSLRELNGAANTIGMKKASFGTDIEYAKFHQYGTSKMPKRKIVYEPTGFARSLALLAADHVANGKVR